MTAAAPLDEKTRNKGFLSLWKGEVHRPARRPQGSLSALNRLLAGVAEVHGLNLEDLRSPRRSKPFVAARWEAVQTAYATGLWSSPVIGRALARDHTTILHAIKVPVERASRRIHTAASGETITA